MATTKYPARDPSVPDYSACMSACEVCVITCNACLVGVRPGGEPLPAAQVCIQACELALHAMASEALIAPAACSACARCCESLALDCMLLGKPEFTRCAQACYRAAHECSKVATLRAGTPGRPCGVSARSRGASRERRAEALPG